MFMSDEWANNKWVKEEQGKRVAQFMMSSFWNCVVYALKIAGPLIRVLKLVDIEKKTPMRYIYEAMDRAKESIASSFVGNEEKYEDIFKIIDHRLDVHASSCMQLEVRDEATEGNQSVRRREHSEAQGHDLDGGEAHHFDEARIALRTYGVVARASGVEESIKQTRATTSRVQSKDFTSTSNTIHLIDEEDATSEDTEEKAKGYKSSGKDDEDADLLVVDIEDDF
ncbi:hAT dimerization domain-containing protein [Actinidia rufa]|uniref:HAT dimerization domain-containing protein n=1 Tax=Actinidia rufa TaxID=165716 RepID=A0A7J0FE19_9ERIC|nr:hAT dimerization domain-containing protein [Actinidia rufa]